MPSISTNQLGRRDAQEGTKMHTIYIVGIAVVAVIVACVALWLGLRWYRKRALKKRQDNSVAAFLSVRGVVKEGGIEKAELSTVHQAPVRPRIVIPEPAAVNPRIREDIVSYHRQSGNFPKPFSFALQRGSAGSPTSNPTDPPGLTPPGLSPSDSRPTSWVRHSFFSARSSIAGSRYSVMSSASSFGSEPTTGTTRKVRQLFSPVLPDELLLTHIGEHLTVIQSFDDGWCIVGRENASAEWTQKKSLFGKTPSVGSAMEGGAANNVELGVVPAWCFLKAVKGLRAERPVRSTSLGITVQMGAGPTDRDNLVSWSNF